MRNYHILKDLKHIVNTTLNVARLVYYRSQWENIRGLNTSDANCTCGYSTSWTIHISYQVFNLFALFYILSFFGPTAYQTTTIQGPYQHHSYISPYYICLIVRSNKPFDTLLVNFSKISHSINYQVIFENIVRLLCQGLKNKSFVTWLSIMM